MIQDATASASPTRRDVLASAGAAAFVASGLVVDGVASQAAAEPADMAREIKAVIGAGKYTEGRVTLTLPELTENGNSSPLGIFVESPMTAADHVRAVHIFSEKNPVAHIARLALGPRAGRAKLATSIRIAESQTIIVVAEMNDGSFWSGKAETVVTTPACIDDSRT